jgi:predicted O-methyltransferase YrrM
MPTNHGVLIGEVEGWLRTADALKIYELAYFTKSNILQLGTFKGLSTAIIIEAIRDSSSQYPSKELDTVDLDAVTTDQAKNTMRNIFGELNYVNYYISDATYFLDSLIIQKKTYDFIFIDHWHGYKSTYTCAIRVNRLLNKGGFVLFHDFNDASNYDRNHIYGVAQAAYDALLTDNRFLFCGTHGSTGLFRYLGEYC